jgi:outer membrane lipoprotein carrier protein
MYKMNVMRLMILTLCLLMATTSFAVNSTTAKVTNLLNQIRTLKGDFNQTIYDNHGKQLQESSGSMALERPGKFRWQVYKPLPQLIIANDNKLWIYDPDLKQVTVRSLQNAATETPALLLSQVDPVLEKDFMVKEMPVKNSIQWYQLTAKRKDSMFSVIELGFNNNMISAMVLQDQLGHSIHISFRHLVSNQNISASTFIFKTPAGVDTIYEAKPTIKNG